MKQRHRKHLVDARQAARLAHRFDREALMQRGVRSSLSWLAEERRRNNWRKKKRDYRKRVKFFGGTQWSPAEICRINFNSKATQDALAAGLPIGRDGLPADPEKFGVIALDARH